MRFTERMVDAFIVPRANTVQDVAKAQGMTQQPYSPTADDGVSGKAGDSDSCGNSNLPLIHC